MAGCYAPAEAARLYDENSASADSEYGGNICNCVDIFVTSEPEAAMKNISLIPFGFSLQREINESSMRVVRIWCHGLKFF